MSIQKKSLISTLKTTKKANVASSTAMDEGTSVHAGTEKVRLAGTKVKLAGTKVKFAVIK